jgi:hypothetical protein
MVAQLFVPRWLTGHRRTTGVALAATAWAAHRTASARVAAVPARISVSSVPGQPVLLECRQRPGI